MGVRSLLFAPGDDERKLRRALLTPADAVVADLEDAVAPERKAQARALVAQVLAEAPSAPGPQLMVRVNAADTPHWDEDLTIVGALALDALVLPKATAATLDALPADGPPIVALIETPRGVLEAAEIARHPRVARLGLGAVDLAAELGLEPRGDGLELLHARSVLAVASAAAGIDAPADTVFADVRDEDGLAAQSRLARSLGFGGKFCIHPAQLDPVNACFAPSAEQLAWAERVLAAFGEAERAGRGVIRVDGAMVDKPVALRAQRLIDSHERTAR